ncbi:MAG: prepilin-type N-terminal cleavage/methylation domain-containing protein [Phycisphaeraceae bacterium]
MVRFRLADSGQALPHAGAFSLVEMLIALAVVMLLMGAIVFNFATLSRGAELDEGVKRLKTALVLARAHAAHTQRPVRLAFALDEDDSFTDPVYRIMFLEKPRNAEEQLGTGEARYGVQSDGEDEESGGGATAEHFAGGYQQVHALRNPQAQVNVVVAVREVRPLGRGGDELDELEREMPETPPAVEFYPDGSSESAEIVLLSRDVFDERRMVVRIVGMTGRITSSEQVDEEEQAQQAEDGGEAEREFDLGGETDPSYRIER